MSNDEKDWKLAMFESAVADPWIRGHAFSLAEAARGPDDVELNLMDLESSRPYLRTCILRMSVAEIAAAQKITLASLWARGTLGAARFRAKRSGKGQGEPSKTR